MYQPELNKFKTDPDIFNSVLHSKQQVSHPPKSLGITFGADNPKVRILKVCNPYCGPCSKSQKFLDELLSTNKEVQLQVIYSVDPDDGAKVETVKMLLSVFQTKSPMEAESIFRSWYQQDEKDVKKFKAKFGVENEAKIDSSVLNEMFKWCRENRVTFFLAHTFSNDTCI